MLQTILAVIIGNLLTIPLLVIAVLIYARVEHRAPDEPRRSPAAV